MSDEWGPMPGNFGDGHVAALAEAAAVAAVASIAVPAPIPFPPLSLVPGNGLKYPMARIAGRMKTLAHSIKSLAIAWLCLFSLANVKAIPNLVLCVGEDGHVEVESAFGNRCGDNVALPPVASLIAPEAGNHCGACSDIAIFSETNPSHPQKQNSGSPSGLQPMGSIISEREAQYARSPSAILWNPPSAPTPPSLLLIRSVRLLV